MDTDPEDYIKSKVKFRHDPSSGEIFAQWYACYSETFECKLTNVPEAKKIRLLWQRFSSVDHNRYLNFHRM